MSTTKRTNLRANRIRYYVAQKEWTEKIKLTVERVGHFPMEKLYRCRKRSSKYAGVDQDISETHFSQRLISKNLYQFESTTNLSSVITFQFSSSRFFIPNTLKVISTSLQWMVHSF